MINDPIADMLIRIKNAQAIRQETVIIPSSKIKQAIAQVLVDNGYITHFERQEGTPSDTLHLTLRYTDKAGTIHQIKRVSKPGARRYSRATELPRPLSGHGLVIVSTPKGIMSGQQAEKIGVGGEVIATVW
jgi:small subunit ribosomal protein S8